MHIDLLVLMLQVRENRRMYMGRSSAVVINNIKESGTYIGVPVRVIK